MGPGRSSPAISLGLNGSFKSTKEKRELAEAAASASGFARDAFDEALVGNTELGTCCSLTPLRVTPLPMEDVGPTPNVSVSILRFGYVKNFFKNDGTMGHHYIANASQPQKTSPSQLVTLVPESNRRVYSHRMGKVGGCYWSGFELSEFVSCDATGLGRWPGRIVYIPDAPLQQTERNYISVQGSLMVRVLEQELRSLNRRMDEPELVYLLFHYDAQKARRRGKGLVP